MNVKYVHNPRTGKPAEIIVDKNSVNINRMTTDNVQCLYTLWRHPVVLFSGSAYSIMYMGTPGWLDRRCPDHSWSRIHHHKSNDAKFEVLLLDSRIM